MAKTRSSNQLRIIAGEWRGRKLSFPDAEGLRPTPDRVRETLFNWLMFDIEGANCADLFAGTGALGLEALSRGAKQVMFFEKQLAVAKALQQNLASLKLDESRAKVLAGDVFKAIAQSAEAGDKMPGMNGSSLHGIDFGQLDILFLDPPYHKGLLQKCLQQLPALKSRCKVYMEYAADEKAPETPQNWQQEKIKKAGQVVYALYQVS